MNRQSTDILVAGGGAAGSIAALAFAGAGFDTLCVDPKSPVTDGDAEGADLRTTAFLQPSVALLDAIGIWAAMSADAMPLRVMRLIDAGGPRTTTRDFVAGDIGQDAFGWNIRNWMLHRTLKDRIAATDRLTMAHGTAVTEILPREDYAIVTLDDGRRIDARMVIAADGRDSPLRDMLGIPARTTRFGQRALSFAVTHDVPHDDVSTEIHASGGPFTLVPLPDRDGRPSSAVIWMEDGAEVQRLSDLDIPGFESEATERSQRLFGPLTLVTRRQAWPIIARLADRIDGPRTALIAEAAHVMPPVGAQGLNTSLADIAALRDLALTRPGALGDRAMLSSYHRARHPDMALRVAGISALNRVSQAGRPPLQWLRAAGLAALHDIAPVRRRAMTMGLGAGHADQRSISGVTSSEGS